MKRELFEKDKITVVNNARADARALENALAVGEYDMDEIARLAVYGCDDGEHFRALYAEIREKIGLDGAVGAPLISGLCKGICAYSAERGRRLTLSDFFNTEKADGARVAYVKNAISDDAYRIFSKVIEGVSVAYLPSFTSACEEVYYGRVPFCILPQENSEEGNLSGFMRLVRKYELYPHYVCTVRGENGTTKLALLGREPYAEMHKKGTKNLKLRLRVSFYAPETVILAKISAVASELGLSLVKTESAPLEWDGSRYAQTFIFEGSEDKTVQFLTYLELEFPDCDKAIYNEID